MKFCTPLLVALSMFVFSVCLVGCTPGNDTTIIEQEQLSEEEIARIDEDYDSQYAEEAAEYEEMEGDGTER